MLGSERFSRTFLILRCRSRESADAIPASRLSRSTRSSMIRQGELSAPPTRLAKRCTSGVARPCLEESLLLRTIAAFRLFYAFSILLVPVGTAHGSIFVAQRGDAGCCL